MTSQFAETGPQTGSKGCHNCAHRGPKGWVGDAPCKPCGGYYGGYDKWKADPKTLAGYIEAVGKDELGIKDDPECHLGDTKLNVTPVPSEGVKYDSDKPRYGLLPANALEDVVRVLTFGAKKYSPDNWKKVPDGDVRYFDAALRHLWAWKRGEVYDQESGFNHLSHAICCLLFMSEGFEDYKQK